MLILVRHGQTQPNAEGRLLGRADPPLNDLGVHQARALATVLGGATRVVSSPLQRARQTAAALGPPVDVDERWAEIDYGNLDGLRLADVPGEVWQRWREDPAWAPPGGESLVDVGQRVRAACDDLAAEAAERDVVVVSHVSPIKAAVAWALGVGDEISWRMFLDVGAVCRIRTGGRGVALVAFNERIVPTGGGVPSPS